MIAIEAKLFMRPGPILAEGNKIYHHFTRRLRGASGASQIAAGFLRFQWNCVSSLKFDPRGSMSNRAVDGIIHWAATEIDGVF